MENIKHKHVEVRGIKLHVAEIGTGPKVVLFLHGFPEIWYTWRHQMIAVANNGCRAIAFDFRGYGLSDQPQQPENSTIKDLVDDVVCLLDALSINKAFVVGKDFGARPAFLVCALYPERVCGLITLSVPYTPKSPSSIQNLLPKGLYISRWQEPGRAEADFGRFDIKTVIKNIYTLFSSSEIPIAGDDDQEIMDLVDPSAPLPTWFSDEDLSIYASLYEKSGFLFPLQVPYRSLNVDIGISDPKVTSPALLIMGEKDYSLNFPGIDDYIRSGTVKDFVPDLDITFLAEGSHFVHEQFPEKVNHLIVNFLDKHGAM